MDWGTHVVLAAKMLKSCNLDRGTAVYSNLPAIDNKPAHYHRVYAHILENQPAILDAALEIFGSQEIKDRDFDRLSNKITTKVKGFEKELKSVKTIEEKWGLESRIYAYTRIDEEAGVFVELADKAKDLLQDEEVSKISSDKLSAAVSLISHVFFDTFNNPVQAFIPFSTLASAQWDFWDQIDYIAFRRDFYKEEMIIPFRKEIASDDIWDIQLKPESLIKAMIIRVGEQGRPAIPYEAIDLVIRNFLRYLDINEYQRVDKEIKFLRELEKRIIKIISAKFPKNIEA